MRESKLKRQIDLEIEVACKPIRDAIWAKYADQLAEAARQDKDEENERLDLLVAEGMSRAKWPVGTKLVEWENHIYQYGQCHIFPWRKTEREGFYEIYDERTSAKVVGATWTGKLFLRLALKNGKPGSKAARVYNWELWLPEGEHPDTYKHPYAEVNSDGR